MLSGAIAAFLVITGLAITEQAPLGHDESVYANRGRFFEGSLDDGVGYWAGYRAPGIPFLLGLVFRVTGPSDAMGRLLIVGFGLLAILVVFVLATALVDAHAGAAAAVLLVLSSGFTRHAALIFVDVPGMAIPLLAVTITYLSWRNGPLKPAVYVAVPLLAMASTYIRFGAPATLFPGMVAVVVVLAPRHWHDRARRFALEAAGLAAVTGAAIALVLMVPWFTAQPVAPLRAQQAFRDAKGVPMLDSVDDLVAIVWPSGEMQDFFHPLAFWATVSFVVLAAVAAIWTPRIRAAVVFGSIGGIGTVVALNVNLSLIAAQYLVLAVPYLVIVAGAGFSVAAEGLSARGPIMRTAAAVVVGAASLYGTVALHERVQAGADSLSTAFAPIREGGFAVRAAGADDCVVLTGTAPQVGWYAQCRMSTWGSVPVAEPLDERIRSLMQRHDPPLTVFVVDILRGKREPSAEVFDDNSRLFSDVAEVGTPEDGFRRYIRILRPDDCVLTESCPPS